jgi:3-dehydroquinate synthetase
MLMALKHESSVIGKLENQLEKELDRILQPIALSIKSWLVSFDENKFRSAFLSDKKHSNEMIRLILPQNGQLALTEVANNSNNLEHIVDISKEIVNKYL